MGRKELVLIDLGACTYLQPLPPAWPCPGHTARLAASSFCCPAPATSSPAFMRCHPPRANGLLDPDGSRRTATASKNKPKTGRQRDTLTLQIHHPVSWLLLGVCVQVAVRRRCELACDINGMRQQRGGAVRT